MTNRSSLPNSKRLRYSFVRIANNRLDRWRNACAKSRRILSHRFPPSPWAGPTPLQRIVALYSLNHTDIGFIDEVVAAVFYCPERIVITSHLAFRPLQNARRINVRKNSRLVRAHEQPAVHRNDPLHLYPRNIAVDEAGYTTENPGVQQISFFSNAVRKKVQNWRYFCAPQSSTCTSY